MSKPFSIQDYKAKNQWKTGAVTKEVGDTPYKGGHNDIRKTNYDVSIVDGKLDLNTHKTVVTESVTINEAYTLSKEEKKEVEDIINGGIKIWIQELGKQVSKDFQEAVKAEFINQVKKIK